MNLREQKKEKAVIQADELFEDNVEIIKDTPNSDLEKGKEIEKEHKPTVDKVREYLETNGNLPPDEMIYEWIAVDHIEEFGNYYDEEIGLPEMERRLEEIKNQVKASKRIKGYRYGLMKNLQEQAPDIYAEITALEYDLIDDMTEMDDEYYVSLATAHDPAVGVYRTIIATFSSLEEFIQWWRDNQDNINVIYQKYEPTDDYDKIDEEIGKLKASYDLNIGTIYDKETLESQGYRFGWEGQNKAIVWEPDGDGWFMEKQPDGSYKCVKQYYEGTQETQERRKYLMNSDKTRVVKKVEGEENTYKLESDMVSAIESGDDYYVIFTDGSEEYTSDIQGEKVRVGKKIVKVPKTKIESADLDMPSSHKILQDTLENNLKRFEELEQIPWQDRTPEQQEEYAGLEIYFQEQDNVKASKEKEPKFDVGDIVKIEEGQYYGGKIGEIKDTDIERDEFNPGGNEWMNIYKVSGPGIDDDSVESWISEYHLELVEDQADRRENIGGSIGNISISCGDINMLKPISITLEALIEKANTTYQPDVYYINMDKLPNDLVQAIKDADVEVETSSYTVGEPHAFMRQTVKTADGAKVEFEVSLGDCKTGDVPEDGDDEETYQYVADEMAGYFRSGEWGDGIVHFEVLEQPAEATGEVRTSVKVDRRENIGGSIGVNGYDGKSDTYIDAKIESKIKANQEVRVRITYSMTTPESVEDGDFSETGWEDEEGILVEADDVESGDIVDAVVKVLQKHYVYQFSGSAFYEGGWWSSGWEVYDYKTGEKIEYNYHIDGLTPEQNKQVYEKMMSKTKAADSPDVSKDDLQMEYDELLEDLKEEPNDKVLLDRKTKLEKKLEGADDRKLKYRDFDKAQILKDNTEQEDREQGYDYMPENIASRDKIQEFFTKHTNPYGAVINPYEGKPQGLLPLTSFMPFYNFSVDIMVPGYDKQLDNLLQQWLDREEARDIEKIANRVVELNGVWLNWE